MKDRTRARGWALQALYAWETREARDTPLQTFRQLESERHVAEDSQAYVGHLLEKFETHQNEVDRAVQDSLSNWRLDRLSMIDRNILRLAATELMFIADVPPRVSIQEAILLAEKYGTQESPRFVNGVLDALMRATGHESAKPAKQERA